MTKRQLPTPPQRALMIAIKNGDMLPLRRAASWRAISRAGWAEDFPLRLTNLGLRALEAGELQAAE